MDTNPVASAQLQYVKQWIKRLEDKAISLLEGLAIDELTPKHQADVALKCLDHVQRFTAIEKRLQDASHANEQYEMLAKMMRAARGEYDLTDNEFHEFIGKETNHYDDEPAPDEPPQNYRPTFDDQLSDEFSTRRKEDEMIESFTERMREKARQREKDEEEDLWQWLGGMMDEARAEGKDFWQWLAEQEEMRQWNSLPEDDLSQDEDDDFWQQIDELEHEQQETPYPHEEMTYEQEQDFWQWLAEQEKEWQEHTCSDEEADQELDSWYHNGWWLNEEDVQEDEDTPWDEL